MQKADKATQHREPSCQRASVGVALDATGKIGAEIGGTQLIECTKARQLSHVLGHKIEKQREVTPIGGDGVGRGATLACQPRDPQPDRRAQVVGRREAG